MDFIESSVEKILGRYGALVTRELHQTQALQLLFDVKFLTTLCVPRENVQLVAKSQSLCDNLRSKIDPFDLDVFYGYLQSNVQKCVFQSQVSGFETLFFFVWCRDGFFLEDVVGLFSAFFGAVGKYRGAGEE